MAKGEELPFARNDPGLAPKLGSGPRPLAGLAPLPDRAYGEWAKKLRSMIEERYSSLVETVEPSLQLVELFAADADAAEAVTPSAQSQMRMATKAIEDRIAEQVLVRGERSLAEQVAEVRLGPPPSWLRVW